MIGSSKSPCAAALTLIAVHLAIVATAAAASGAARAAVERFEGPPANDEPFARADPGEAGVDPVLLDDLIDAAAARSSDALVVVKDGRLLCDRTFGCPRGPIEAMSATKSIVGLAICLLADEGRIDSIDAPVHAFYPEWRQGRKESITLRHLLTHTSGLQTNRTTEKIYASPDFVQFAIAAELASDPGEVFVYNNSAVNLLAGIVQRASGRRMDEYLAERLFAPLGITDFSWTLDGAGNPHGMAGLQIGAVDLAKIGQMMLDRGTWRGAHVVSESSVDASFEPSRPAGMVQLPAYGLLWWLTPAWDAARIDEDLFAKWRAGGADEAFMTKMAPLVGRRFGGPGEDSQVALFKAVIAAMADSPGGAPKPLDDQLVFDHPAIVELTRNTTGRGLPMCVLELGPIASVAAKGYLGQYLVIVPGTRVVAVRQRRYPADESPLLNDRQASFVEFEAMVRELGRGRHP